MIIPNHNWKYRYVSGKRKKHFGEAIINEVKEMVSKRKRIDNFVNALIESTISSSFY